MQILQAIHIIRLYILGFKMKNIYRIIFIVTTLLLFSLPILFFDSKQKVSEKENRVLEQKPRFMKDNLFNDKVFSEYNCYFQDHFGFREQLIQLDANNPLKMKSPIKVGRALVGKDGWYFYTDPTDGNNLMDFYKRNLFDTIQIKQFSEKISNRVKWCEENNIKCIFIIGPNKHSVYAEFYPYIRPEGITRADQITQKLDQMGVSYVFPRDHLLAVKEDFNYPLYYETDTHWNQKGAYIASTLLYEKLQTLFPDTLFPKIEYETLVSESETYGDLLPMLNLERAKSTKVILSPSGCNTNDFYSYLNNGGRDGVHTKGTNNKLPRALIYRDSFFTALESFVSPFFSEAEYHWKPFEETDKDYVLEYKPDIIIFECVERSIISL